jgi:hypothetical protein
MDHKLSDFHVGQRVKMHPATDAFMQGDVYAIVDSIGTKNVRVRYDRSGRIRYVRPENLLPIEGSDTDSRVNAAISYAGY